MGAIVCHLHGKQVVAFIAKYHHARITNGDKCLKHELVSVEVVDDEKLLDGNYLCDSFSVEELNIVNDQIHIQKEPIKFELMFASQVPVCPICLHKYLNYE